MNPLLDYARAAKLLLDQVGNQSPGEWPAQFVALRMGFCWLFPHGTLSTSHGIDFFDNVIAGPEAWKEESEYGENFREMLRDAAQGRCLVRAPVGKVPA